MSRPSSINLTNDATKSVKCGITSSIPIPLILQGQETSPGNRSNIYDKQNLKKFCCIKFLIYAGQWPWHAALYHHKGYEIKYACGATLITEQHVVTVAHCVTGAGTKAVMDRSVISIGLGKKQ